MLESAEENGTMILPIKAKVFLVHSSVDREWMHRLSTPHPVGCFVVTILLYVSFSSWKSMSRLAIQVGTENMLPIRYGVGTALRTS